MKKAVVVLLVGFALGAGVVSFLSALNHTEDRSRVIRLASNYCERVASAIKLFHAERKNPKMIAAFRVALKDFTDGGTPAMLEMIESSIDYTIKKASGERDAYLSTYMLCMNSDLSPSP